MGLYSTHTLAVFLSAAPRSTKLQSAAPLFPCTSEVYIYLKVTLLVRRVFSRLSFFAPCLNNLFRC